MLAPLETLAHLKSRLAEAMARVPLRQGPGLASFILPLPEVPRLAPQLPGAQFHFTHRHRRELLAGYGHAREWRAAGTDRLGVLRACAEDARAVWHQHDPDRTGQRGFALLGFAASPLETGEATPRDLPNALLWVPELALRCRGDEGVLVLTTRLPTAREALLARWNARLNQIVPVLGEPAPELLPAAPPKQRRQCPDLAHWRDLVEAALEQIARGRLDKVVLARRLRVAGRRPFGMQRLESALGHLFPSCQVISLRREGRSFVAATPERLFTQRGDWVEVDAIAGTAARSANSAQDVALGEALLASTKNLHEHALVVRAVREALAPCSRRLEVPEQPRVMRLNNAQHLWTPIQAELRPGMDLFHLAQLLHPTPATNGTPRQAAHAWLRREEPFARGWYTGVAGILEPDLTGELWVLLRCARIQGDRADLYAGAGLVAGSDPLSEWRETEDKLAAMLTALQFA